MNSTIEFFDLQASVYDLFQSACVPKYQEMLSVASGWLKRYTPDTGQLRLLDIGCGTGNATRELFKLFPRAVVCCVDGSAEMISKARTKLSSRSVEFRCHDLGDIGWNEPWMDHPFDAALSALVLEHLPHDAYRTFLTTALAVLKPGAWMVTAEGYAGEKTQSIYFGEMTTREEEAVRAGILSRRELDHIKRLSAEKETHYFASVHEKKEWWQEAGFTEVDLIWRYYCVGIMVGRKRS